MSKQLIVFLIMQILLIIPKLKNFKIDLLEQKAKDIKLATEAIKTNNTIKRILFISIVCAITYGLATLSFLISLSYSIWQPVTYIGWNICINNFLDIKVYKYLSMLIDELFLIYAIRCLISMINVIKLLIKSNKNN